jgi:hypothetical protein
VLLEGSSFTCPTNRNNILNAARDDTGKRAAAGPAELNSARWAKPRRVKVTRPPILKTGAPTAPKPSRTPLRPGVFLEEDEPTARHSKAEVSAALGHGGGKPPAFSDLTLHSTISRLPAGSSLIYTLHTLLI